MVTTARNSEKAVTYQQAIAWREELFDGRSLRVPVEELDSWGLREYLWAAVTQAMLLRELRDENEQNWRTPAWDFGRFAKAHPALFYLDENCALAAITETIGTRFWEDQFHMNRADAEMAFDHVWVACRSVPGYDSLALAISEAKGSACEGDPGAPAGYTTFLAVARCLQGMCPDSAFMLPCHKLSRMLACLPMTISRYRKKAVRDGQLKVVKNHSYCAAGGGEATEFVFVGDRVDLPGQTE